MITEDAIATTVLTTFATLPSKYKPRDRADGSKEWVPISGIVIEGLLGVYYT
jgi:tRNA-specific adenosine deaminase 1